MPDVNAPELPAFIAACYDHAEALIDAIEDNSAPWDGQWTADDNHAIRTYNGHVLAYAHGSADLKPGFAAYVAANDPAHRRADLALKRAILAAHPLTVTKRETYRFDSYTGQPIPEEYDGDCGTCGWFDPEHGGCLTVRHLGTEFGKQPGYKKAWRPDSDE